MHGACYRQGRGHPYANTRHIKGKPQILKDWARYTINTDLRGDLEVLYKMIQVNQDYNNQIIKHINTKTGVIYRNYNCKNRYKVLTKIAKICRKKSSQLFVSNNMRLALKVNADGIYIPSFNNSRINGLNLNKKILLLGSAHNQKEIHTKITQKCDAIFLSPIF